jgi:hypothetical protein
MKSATAKPIRYGVLGLMAAALIAMVSASPPSPAAAPGASDKPSSPATPDSAAKPETFATPEQAATAMVDAAEKFDVPSLLRIVGSDG